ncbi:MAG: EpsG family protein [Clostridia bacterium]|nr:EpsG family protein [Clostridia bacterium]
MWVWLFMLISIILVRFLIPDAIGEKKKNLIFLGVSFCILVFVMGSRSPHMSGSNDMMSYFRCYGNALYQSTGEMIDHYRFEAGYIILNEILAWLAPWNYFILYFEAAFCTFVMFWYIYRNADSVFLAVIVYICLGPWQFFLTGFRQTIAICLCFIAFEFLKKHKTMWDLAALALIALAASMHTTAWIFLSAFLIRKFRITKKVVIYTGILTLFLFLFVDDIVAFGNDILDKNYALAYRGNVLGGLIPILIYIFALILTYFIWTWDSTYLDKNGFEVAMLIVGMCIYFLRYTSIIMERISFYFTPTIIIVLSNGITRQRTKTVRNIAFVACIVVCFALFIYRTLVQYGDYHFYWEYLEGLA